MTDNLYPTIADNQAPAVTPPPAGNTPPAESEKFYSGFEEGLKNHPSIVKFASSADLAKSYVNLEKKIGSKGIIMPGKDAKPEEVNEFYKQLGCLDKPEKVEIVLPPQGSDDRIQVTDELKSSFKDIAIKAHLTPEQAKVLQEWHLGVQTAHLKRYDETVEAERQKAETTLRSEWGEKFEENIKKANQLVKSIGGEEALEWFAKGEGNNPIVLKMMAVIANKISEDSLGEGGKGSLTLTPAEAKAKINSIREDKSHPFNISDHRLHKEAVEEMQTLYKFSVEGN